MNSTTKYEVQFKDGFGAWRRWSLNSRLELAENSRARFLLRCGPVPGAEGNVRIVERRA